jgi:hypothetical protein
MDILNINSFLVLVHFYTQRAFHLPSQSITISYSCVIIHEHLKELFKLYQIFTRDI